MATGFNTQVSNGEYRLQFETDNREYYLLMQSTARRCVDCVHMTNAQKIRAMTDDELADFMNRDISGCPPTGDCNKASDDCKACWLDWLQQPAEDNDKNGV